jgi:hypothetical protein
MAAFAARLQDSSLTEQFERTLAGKGAFRRFRDLIFDTGLESSWEGFSADRRIGRARRFLAAHDIRAVPGV